ncbi:CHAD domain-containing protein [Nitrososphaera sp.]|uniref:CHAD domain-containing protein n=1 Tax=Nitrososphaera sp. TaxID=1971748 RepID=UPI002ED99F57
MMGLAALFASRFEKSAQLVKERLRAYMAEPDNEEKVHDVRTSLRRLDASFLLMPKKFRKRNRRQIDAHKQFFRANSRVRDYDIMRGRMAARAQGELLSQLADALDKKRKAGVARALGMARLLFALPAASLEGLGDEELESTMDEVAGRLVGKIKKRFPVVAANRGAVEELHELRKDLKKLRYVFEVMPAGLKKPYEKKASKILNRKKKPVMQQLKELQDALGAMHDIDITLQYLAALGKKTAVSLIESEKAERDELFSKFAQSFRA